MKKQNMKEFNKGFSLIELIVVVAIMVVLVSVLGSTILGYVDKAKIAKDVQAADELARAIHRCLLFSDGLIQKGIAEGDIMCSIAWNKAGAEISDDTDPSSILYYVGKELDGRLPVSSYDEDCLFGLHIYYKNRTVSEQNLVIKIYLGPTDKPWDMMKGSGYDEQYMLYPEVGSYWNR